MQSLKEFFLLAKIAEAEGIKVEEEDLEAEVMALALRTDESPRRVRARVQKEGLDDVLASQILERKTIDRILQYVKLVEVPMAADKAVETLDQSVSSAEAGEATGTPSDDLTPSA